MRLFPDVQSYLSWVLSVDSKAVRPALSGSGRTDAASQVERRPLRVADRAAQGRERECPPRIGEHVSLRLALYRERATCICLVARAGGLGPDATGDRGTGGRRADR